MGNYCPRETDDGGCYKSPEGTRPPPRGKVRREQRPGKRTPLLLQPAAVQGEDITPEVDNTSSLAIIRIQKLLRQKLRRQKYKGWQGKKGALYNKLWQVVTFSKKLAEALFIKKVLWEREIKNADKEVLQGSEAVTWEVSLIEYRGLSIPPQDMLDSTFQIPFNGDVEEFLVVSLIVKATDSTLWRYTINDGWKTFISRTADINNQTVDKVKPVDVLVHGITVTRYHVVPDNGSSTSGVPGKLALKL